MLVNQIQESMEILVLLEPNYIISKELSSTYINIYPKDIILVIKNYMQNKDILKIIS